MAQVVDAMVAAAEGFEDEDSGGVGEGLEDVGAGLGLFSVHAFTFAQLAKCVNMGWSGGGGEPGGIDEMVHTITGINPSAGASGARLIGGGQGMDGGQACSAGSHIRNKRGGGAPPTNGSQWMEISR